MKILKKISKVIVIVMAVLATIWCRKLLHRGTTVNPLAV